MSNIDFTEIKEKIEARKEESAQKEEQEEKAKDLVYNLSALRNNKPVYIVEGIETAKAIEAVDGIAIGLPTQGNILDPFIDMLTDGIKAQLIIALDEKSRAKEIRAIAEELNKLNVEHWQYEKLNCNSKSILEAYQTDNKAFIEAVRTGERINKQADQQEYYKSNAKNCMTAFIEEIQKPCKSCIPTGYKELDKALENGLYDGLYFIGAISSLGKTTFLVNVMDNIAKNGNDVLFFSLEMARNEIIAKSISRLTYELCNNTANAKTTRGILSNERHAKYSQTEKKLFEEAVEAYKQYADHVYILEGYGAYNLKNIKATVDKHIEITGRTPVVMVDYLQMLAPDKERMTERQAVEKNVLELKRLSRKYKTPVICISSLNRESYKANSTNKGRVTMADFKESGGIEYSSDVLIGLQFATAGNNYDEGKARKGKNGVRDVQAVILKNRNGGTGEEINFKYNMLFNKFIETGTIKKEEVPKG